MLIINADDWGHDEHTTSRILACVKRGAVSSVSSMLFMRDSERAAALARDHGIDAGLHLNLDTSFSARRLSGKLLEHQLKLAHFLRNRFARPFFHPRLVNSFEYAVSAQFDEYNRLYGAPPQRIDGHHHVHLCANVLLSGLLPASSVIRPHFASERGEKRIRNSLFRCYAQCMLAKRYRTVDCLVALPPLEPSRLMRIISRSNEATIEVETHPVNPAEFELLTEGALFRLLGETPLSSHHLAKHP
jgi:predicted glycoside hydrolase/deacetylase ChbG (UPF0249 family)